MHNFSLRIKIEKHICLLYLTANLAFRMIFAHPTPSVFHADHHGGCAFLIWTLGLELRGHPRPLGDPNISKPRK